MATIDSTTNSGQRRRRLALMLALLLACTAIAIGGSLYYQQKKAKAAAVAAAKTDNSTGNLAAGAGPSAQIISTSLQTEEVLNVEAPTQSAPVAIAPRHKRRPADDSKQQQDDSFAESVLAQAPAGAGPLEIAPALSPAGPQDVVSAAPQALTPGPTIALGPSDGAGIGAVPGAAPNPLPAGSGGIVATIPTPVSPVPEPSTWLMMAAGLGLLVSRRRSK